MQALAIVTFTLSGFAGLLFGSDVLDRRPTLRASAAAPARPTDERAVAADAARPHAA